MNLDDLRSVLDDRSASPPADGPDHRQRLAGVWHKHRTRRIRQGVAVGSVLLVVAGGIAMSSMPMWQATPTEPHPSAVAPTRPAATASPSPSRSVSPTPMGSSGATPGPSRPPAFPGLGNTGLPAGTRLTSYPGPCTITTDNTVIEARTVNCDLSIRATNVVISKSRISGTVTTGAGGASSYTLVDSEVDGGGASVAVGGSNLTVLRSIVRGAGKSIQCGTNCTVRDSYLNSFLANNDGVAPGVPTNVSLVHNTIVCEASPGHGSNGCSGEVMLFADYGPVNYVRVEGNLFGASTAVAYCAYGGSSPSKKFDVDHVVFVNNVFQHGTTRKCGAYGAVTSFDTRRPGNVWTGNVWDDGTPVQAER